MRSVTKAPVTKGPKPKFAKGRAVLFLNSQVHDIQQGVVIHYNPAVTGSAVITEGDPVYTVRTLGGFHAVVSDVHVASATVAGRQYLQRLLLYYGLRGRRDDAHAHWKALATLLTDNFPGDPTTPGGFAAPKDKLNHGPSKP